MGGLLQNLRYAARMFGRTPGFTAVAVFTLALGVGANTAIFSLMNAFVLRPLRVHDPGRLVIITEIAAKQGGQRTPTMSAFLEWKKSSRSLQDIALAAFGGDPMTLSGIGRSERISVAFCGVNYLSMLGVKPFRGRFFLTEDAPDGKSQTLVISQRLWQRTFGADPNVLGQSVLLGGEKLTIAGILPHGFSVLPWEMDVDAWIGFRPTASQLRFMPKMGRLKAGVTVEQAQTELNAIAQGMEPRLDADQNWSVRLQPLHEWLVGGASQYFYILLGAVGFVLLIACANVANLLLARGATRQREIAIRASLGASRWRLIRQLLAESLLLALVGGAFGIVVGLWGTRILTAISPFDVIRTLDVRIDLRVLGFTLGIAVLTGVLFGLAPAFRFSKPDVHESLKLGPAQAGGPRQRSQDLLLVSEVALAVVLLTGAGLMIKSFVQMRKVDLGFNPQHVLRADIFLDGPKFWHNTPGKPGFMKTITQQGDAFFRRLLERVEALPGVTAAGISHLAPPGDVEPRIFRVMGRPAPAPGQELRARYNEVGSGYFHSLEIPLRKGRYLTERDNEGAPWVVLINETMARRYFPNEDPIGKFVQTTLEGGSNTTLEESRPREIVGVVGDVRQYGYGSDQQPMMYGSYHQHGMDYPTGLYTYHLWKSITVRTAGDPMRLVAALQRVVADLDKDQALFDIQSAEQGLSESVAFPRFQMRLFGFFGGLGLLLAAGGIYGVLSYLVVQRTHEIGVRVALGAGRGEVLRLVILRGLKSTAIGLALGIAGSLALTRMIAGFLFGVRHTDTATYVSVALTLAAVAFAACYVPARRATKVEPAVALRHE